MSTCVNTFKHESLHNQRTDHNEILSEACGGGKAALDFEPDRIRILVSMATDSSNRVLMGKTVLPLFLDYFSSDLFILAGNEDIHKRH